MRLVRVTGRLIGVVFLLVPWQFGGQVFAEDTPPLIITEIKIRNDTAGFDEFIEFYNPTAATVSLNDYQIAYINTPAPAPDQEFAAAVIGDGLLESENSFILAKNEVDPNLPFAKKLPFSSLSDSGGTLRILDSQNDTIDQFAWTSTQSLAITPVQYLPGTTAAKSQSFSRSQDVDGHYESTDPQWELASSSPTGSQLSPSPTPEPEPESDTEAEPEPAPDPDTSTNDEPESQEFETPAESTGQSADAPSAESLQITELLPNPAPPANDSDDEFIELYNSSDQPVDLTGYKLQSGNTFSYSHTFTSTSLAGHEYRAFLITETGAILSNSGGQARLLNPAGVIVAQTNVYNEANDGDAWAFINGAWQWTTTQTPNAPNELTLPILKVATTKAAATKKTAAVKKTTPKKTTAKATSAKTTKTKPAAEREVYDDPEEVPASLHPGILAGVGVITVVYAAYEYRHDALNALKRFNRYRDLRRATRQEASGR